MRKKLILSDPAVMMGKPGISDENVLELKVHEDMYEIKDI